MDIKQVITSERVRNTIFTIYHTTNISVLDGTHLDIIHIQGDYDISLIVEDATVSYWSGLPNKSAFEINKLARVLSVIQSEITFAT